MKATELMIGDWVKLKTDDGTFIKVHISALSFEYIWGIIDDDEANDAIGYDYLEPIPLTAEILNKNFPKSCDNDYWVDGDFPIIGYSIPCHTDGYCPYVEVSIYNPARVMEFELYLNYVHELQHALRLCGIEKEIEL